MERIDERIRKALEHYERGEYSRDEYIRALNWMYLEATGWF